MPKTIIEPPLEDKQCVHDLWTELMGKEGYIATYKYDKPYFDATKITNKMVSIAVITVGLFFEEYYAERRSLQEGHNEITRIGIRNANNSKRAAG